MSTATKSVDVGGDILNVSYNGSQWVSPHNGEQHGTAEEAMEIEIGGYFLSCGLNTRDPSIVQEMMNLLEEMT